MAQPTIKPTRYEELDLAEPGTKTVLVGEKGEVVAVEGFEDDVANTNSELVDNVADIMCVSWEIVGGLMFVAVPLTMKTPKL